MLRLRRAAALVCGLFLVGMGSQSSGQGIAVNFVRSPIVLSTVWSTIAFNYDYVNGSDEQISFNDCLYYIVRTKRRIKRIEFVFALSGPDGKLPGPALPVDVIYRNDAKSNEGDKQSSCKIYGYENGARGLPLIAWVNAVHFVDGTVWHAPRANNLRVIISGELSKQ